MGLEGAPGLSAVPADHVVLALLRGCTHDSNHQCMAVEVVPVLHEIVRHVRESLPATCILMSEKNIADGPYNWQRAGILLDVVHRSRIVPLDTRLCADRLRCVAAAQTVHLISRYPAKL